MKQLFIIPTPIGNIKEVSQRTKDIFKDVNVFLCEDTRVTMKLFDLLKINRENKKFISNHKFNESNRILSILEILKTENIGLVSDAGAPTINDPGHVIVKECINNNIKVTPISGPSSIVNMIMGSGIEMDKFSYVGFLPKKEKELQTLLNDQFQINSKIIFLLSVHQFENTLTTIGNIYPEAKLSIGKELTKLYENFFYGSAKDIVKMNPIPKGEYIGIIEYSINEEVSEKEIIQLIGNLRETNISNKDILEKIIFKYKRLSKNYIYNLINKENEKYEK